MTAVVLRGDARNLPLPDESIDLVVTSPPFWQLRSYTDGGEHYDGQIGAEPTPQEYIASLLECTREWIRVLKPSGSLFIELGDKYAGGGGQWDKDQRPDPGRRRAVTGKIANRGLTGGFPAKCLLDLPARYSIACVDQLGLIKRANIVWNHVNGLPESVTDRVRAAHSMVFHFTRLPRYFAAVDEIREPHEERFAANHKPGNQNGRKTTGTGMNLDLAGIRKPPNPLGKLPGSVWSIPSAPLVVPERLGVDHFAAYPPELCRRIIAGWSPPGICTACGEGRRPVSLRDMIPDPQGRMGTYHGGDSSRLGHAVERKMFDGIRLRTITGYACACPQPDAPTRPAVVLDPFAGTGTTMLVASVLGRVGVGVDRSMDYARLARWRTRDPGERARALGVPKPPPVPDGQGSLFDGEEAS